MTTARKKSARNTRKATTKPLESGNGPDLTLLPNGDLVDTKLVRPRISGDTAIALNSYAARIGLPVASLVTVACIDYLKRMGENV